MLWILTMRPLSTIAHFPLFWQYCLQDHYACLRKPLIKQWWQMFPKTKIIPASFGVFCIPSLTAEGKIETIYLLLNGFVPLFHLCFIATHPIPRFCLKTSLTSCFLSFELQVQDKEWEENRPAPSLSSTNMTCLRGSFWSFLSLRWHHQHNTAF